MNGTWNEWNEQIMPTSNRQDYPWQSNPAVRARALWYERMRAVREQEKKAGAYRPVGAGVVMLPDRQTLKLTRLETDKDGYSVVPVRKAEVKQPACLLCGLNASERDKQMVFSQVVHAHPQCIAALQRKLNQPEKPAHKARVAMSAHPTDEYAGLRRGLLQALTTDRDVQEGVKAALHAYIDRP